MASKVCPCNKKRNGWLFIQCAEEDCSIVWWHAACSGFNNDVTRKQVDAITRWKCPCCVIKSLNVPGYSLNIKCDSCENLVAKVGEQIDHLKSEIGELQDLKRSFAEIETEKFEQQRLWSEVVRSTDGNKNHLLLH